MATGKFSLTTLVTICRNISSIAIPNHITTFGFTPTTACMHACTGCTNRIYMGLSI